MKRTKRKPLEERIVKGKAIKLRQNFDIIFDAATQEKLKEAAASFKLKESQSSGNQRKMVVTVEGIHTGMTKNKTFYPGDTLSGSVESWTNPHQKPVLKNHNESSEPLGRIISAEYVESILTDKFTIRMKLEITDPDAIQKFADGRYKTFSVGGSANKVSCSICAKNLVEEGYCGHWRGRKYDGKETHWIISDYTGDEISVVNMPADVFSQAIACEMVGVEEGSSGMKKKKKQEDKEPKKKVPGQTSEADDGIGLAGKLLEEEEDKDDDDTSDDDSDDDTSDDDTDDDDNVDDGDDTDDDDDSDEDDEEEEEDSEDDDSDDADDTDDGKDDSDDKDAGKESAKIVRLKAKLKDANTRIKQLESDNAKLVGEATESTQSLQAAEQKAKDAETKLAEATKRAETAEANLASSEDESKGFQESAVKMARTLRKSMAERVVDYLIFQGKEKAEDRDALLAEWSKSTPKVLESQIQTLSKDNPRVIARLTNPGYGVRDKNDVDDGVDGSVSTKENKPTTMGDFIDTMVEKIVR